MKAAAAARARSRQSGLFGLKGPSSRARNEFKRPASASILSRTARVVTPRTAVTRLTWPQESSNASRTSDQYGSSSGAPRFGSARLGRADRARVTARRGGPPRTAAAPKTASCVKALRRDTPVNWIVTRPTLTVYLLLRQRHRGSEIPQLRTLLVPSCL